MEKNKNGRIENKVLVQMILINKIIAWVSMFQVTKIFKKLIVIALLIKIVRKK